VRHFSALITLALLSVLLCAPAASARTPSGFQRGIHQVTNGVREAHDRAALSKRKCVQRFAKKQARRMARQERMFHQDLQPVLDTCGLRRAGENVAYGFTSPQSVMDAWMDSDGHRRNILDKRFRRLGVGAKQSEDGTWYLAQVFGRR
jgi:uncharacterized protein YkwD